MKRILCALLLVSGAAEAQVYNYFPPPGITYGLGSGLSMGAAIGGAQGPGTINAQGLFVNGVAVATGGTPGGVNGAIQYNNSGNFGGFIVTGDCTINTSTGVEICLGTNGVPFGTAATINTGTSGATVPLLNGVNTWAAAQSFVGITATAITDSSITGLTQCLHASSTGLISGTGSDCGSGGGGSSAFNALTGGTNTTAAMVVGTGASLNVSGTGTINANALNGTSVPASAPVVGTNSSGQIVAQTAIPLTNIAQIATGNVLGNFSGITAPPAAQPSVLITSGTSGGILGFTSNSTLASSAALTAGTPVCGGGAGATPLNCTLGGLTTFGLAELAATNAFTAAQSINQATAGTFGLEVDNTGDAGNVESIQSLAANLGTGHNFNQILGRATSTNNAGVYWFNYQGAGSASNSLNLGLYGQSAAVTITQAEVSTNLPTTESPGYTIAGLPSCTSSLKGAHAFVTNAQTTPTYLGAVSSTGAVTAPVFCNGSGWVYD